MTKTWGVVACVVLACAGPAAAAGEDPKWEPGKRFTESATRVMGGIKKASEKNNYGYCDGICVLAAFLANGEKATFVRHFAKGEAYAVIGGGDDGVQDLDVAILDKDDKVIASDLLADAVPVVEFKAPAAGMYTIRVDMAKAGRNGGCATIGILVKGGFAVPVRNLAVALTNLIVQCEDVNDNTPKSVSFSSGNNQWAVLGSMIKQGGELTVEKLTPGAGDRVFLSGGDTTAQDLDLYLLDAKGAELKSDVLNDAIPRVRYTTRGNNTQYGFRVKNVQSNGASFVLTAVLKLVE